MSRRTRLEEMLRADPNDTFLHYALALEDLSEGNPGAARQRLEDVLQRDSKYVAAYFQLGQLLAEAGEANEARSVIERGIAAARDTGDAHAESEMTGFLATLG
ncbi:MAG TPA: tetratricopeptide repeat protein [Planctomycetaceae bacterium]|nr:tetratricopeptide repeat protein [Planctomycetaceae bacterium]